MTRINIVPAKELYDQHLIAEYREIFMVGSSLQRSLKSPGWPKCMIPEEFTLNQGHVKFFYNKGLYLHKRYDEICIEMRRRGFAPDPRRVFKREQWPDHLYNDWHPGKQDKKITRQRIKMRVMQKPDWYRKTPRRKYP